MCVGFAAVFYKKSIMEKIGLTVKKEQFLPVRIEITEVFRRIFLKKVQFVYFV